MAGCSVCVSLCECVMSSVCDSSVNASLWAPEEMQSAVAVAHLTHPSAHAHFCTHNATLHFCTQRPPGIPRGGRKTEMKKSQSTGNDMNDRERKTDENGVRQQQRDPEWEQKRGIVKAVTHCLSGSARSLFLPRSGHKCCAPIFSVHFYPICAGDSLLAGPLICSCDLYKVRQVKKSEWRGEDPFAPELWFGWANRPYQWALFSMLMEDCRFLLHWAMAQSNALHVGETELNKVLLGFFLLHRLVKIEHVIRESFQLPFWHLRWTWGYISSKDVWRNVLSFCLPLELCTYSALSRSNEQHARYSLSSLWASTT